MASTDRERVKKKRITGRVENWKGHYGWIVADKSIDHPEAGINRGRIYVHSKDVILEADGQSLQPGDAVSFVVYADGRGLGAEDCRLRADLAVEAKRRKQGQAKEEVEKEALTAAAQSMNQFASDGSFIEQCRKMQREQLQQTLATHNARRAAAMRGVTIPPPQEPVEAPRDPGPFAGAPPRVPMVVSPRGVSGLRPPVARSMELAPGGCNRRPTGAMMDARAPGGAAWPPPAPLGGGMRRPLVHVRPPFSRSSGDVADATDAADDDDGTVEPFRAGWRRSDPVVASGSSGLRRGAGSSSGAPMVQDGDDEGAHFDPLEFPTAEGSMPWRGGIFASVSAGNMQRSIHNMPGDCEDPPGLLPLAQKPRLGAMPPTEELFDPFALADDDDAFAGTL